MNKEYLQGLQQAVVEVNTAIGSSYAIHTVEERVFLTGTNHGTLELVLRESGMLGIGAVAAHAVCDTADANEKAKRTLRGYLLQGCERPGAVIAKGVAEVIHREVSPEFVCYASLAWINTKYRFAVMLGNPRNGKEKELVIQHETDEPRPGTAKCKLLQDARASLFSRARDLE